MRKDLQVTDTEHLQTAGAAPSEAILCDATGVAGSDSCAGESSGAETADPGLDLDALQRRAWRAFLTRHARVARQLEADLVARHDLPLAEFDVLFQLATADGERLRMNELADRVLLSRAGITRLVDRLVADGLVGRAKCASDARGSFAVLTDNGRTRLREARPGHFAAVQRYFLRSFTPAELQQLAELMERPAPTD